jgi:predicted N-acetyltransferase YhbS
MNPTDIKVQFLADVPEHGPTAMEWIYKTWGAAPDKTLEDVKRKAQQYGNRSTLPIMFVATLNNAPAGCVILKENDMRGWERLTPWLASLYVVPALRGKGVAAKLEKFLTAAALDLGYDAIYLFTPDAVGLYKRLGWQIFQKTDYQRKEVYIMTKKLQRTGS